MTSPQSELRRLTGLRFFAAVLVVVHHGADAVAPIPVLTPIASLGYVGVTFFFVLSGFVLTWSADSEMSTRHFYGRRFARVYPTHFVTLAIVLLAWSFMNRDIGFVALAASVPLLHAWLPGPAYTETLNSVSWSLSDEAFFYAVFPFLLPALSARKNVEVWRWVGIVLAVTILAIPFFRLIASAETAGNMLYKIPALRVGEFLVGVALALMFRNRWRPRVSLGVAAGVVMVAYAGTVAGLAMLGRLDVIRAVPDLLLVGPLALLIVCAARADLDGAPPTGLASGPVVLLGKASFQLYMTHFLVLMALAGAFPSAAQTSAWVAVVVLALFTLVATALSIVSFKAFEVPTERWLRRRLGGVRSTAPDCEAGPASRS